MGWCMLAIVKKSLKELRHSCAMYNACNGALHLPVPYGCNAAWRIGCRGQLTTVWAEGHSCACAHQAALENYCAAQRRVLHNVDAGIFLDIAPCGPEIIMPHEHASPMLMRQATRS